MTVYEDSFILCNFCCIFYLYSYIIFISIFLLLNVYNTSVYSINIFFKYIRVFFL